MRWHQLILAVIILLAATIRFIGLESNPAGFFADEASVGYNAYSILTRGTDEWGTRLPLFFNAFGEYKNPLDVYLTVPFVAIFGLNETAVRASSTFFGVLTVFVFYFIGKKLNDEKFGLVLAFLLAINPWHIHLSRINLEGFTIFLFLLALAIYTWLSFRAEGEKSHSHNKEISHSANAPFEMTGGKLIAFTVLCALATYAYFPARIVVPPFFAMSLIILFARYRKNVHFFVASVFLFGLLLTPLILHMISGEGASRWQQVSLFKNQEISPIKKIVTSYALHFSPDFLFLKGDIDMPGQFITRHSVRGMGEFYLWQAPFIIWGLNALFKRKKNLGYSMLALLLLYPIPSSLTADVPPQATRALTGIIPLTILSGTGVWEFVQHATRTKLKTTLLIILSAVVLISFLQFIRLWKAYPSYSADYWGWQYGPKVIMEYFLTHKHEYDELYMSGDFNAPEIFLKFYDPEHICTNCVIGGIDRADPNKKQLFVISASQVKENQIPLEVKKIIHYPNGQEAFYIGEILR